MAMNDPSLTFAAALAAGMVAHTLAHHLRVPSIVVLLLSGVVLGPDVLGVIRPDSLGHGLEVLVGLSVAVILFDGGLNLDAARLRREAVTIRRLVTLGALTTAVGGTLATRLLMGWPWKIAVLFGTLVIVTGPTVVTPLLRRIRVERKVGTILEAEGVLIDPIGAITAVVALELVLDTEASSAAVGLLGIPIRLLVGVALGVGGGLLIAALLRSEELVPDGLENVFALSLVLALFALSNTALPESGIMAAVVAGLVVGNTPIGREQRLRAFKEHLSVMLVGLLFVLLAADVRLYEVVGLGWKGLAVVLVLALVIRPLGVALSAYRSDLSYQERTFMAWLGPRGIVAAAVASLFAESLSDEGIPLGPELRALVFLVIAVTVVVQGLSGAQVASLLRVRSPRSGYVIVGANAIGRTIAHLLQKTDESVVLVDSNEANVGAAREEGLTAVLGNANDENRLLEVDLEARRGFIAVTSNEAINLLLARRAREQFKVPGCVVAVDHAHSRIRAAEVHEAGGAILFGRAVEIDCWTHWLSYDAAVLQAWRYVGDRATASLPGIGPASGGYAVRYLPLVLVQGAMPAPFTDRVRVRTGSVLILACLSDDADALSDVLSAAGWEAVDPEVEALHHAAVRGIKRPIPGQEIVHGGEHV